jgi:hypothetical protein
MTGSAPSTAAAYRTVHGPVRDDASGTLIRWLMPPDPAGDRLPIGVADLAARESAYWDGNRFGQYFCVLDGEIMDGDRVGPAVGVHVDAPHALPMAAGAAGARVILMRPVVAPVHSVAPR